MFVKRNSIIDVLHAYMDENSIEENNKSPNIVECIENIVKYKFGNNYDNLKQYNKQTNHDFADALALLLDSFESLGSSNTEEAFNIYIPNKIASSESSQKGITYYAGTVLMTNNGSRSPVVQKNDGKTYSVICSDYNYGGGWIGIVSVSYSYIEYVGEINNYPGTGSTFTMDDGRVGYSRQMGTSSTYGGGTTYENPLNLPVIDYPVAYTNASVPEETLKSFAKHLDDDGGSLYIILRNKDNVFVSNTEIILNVEG